MKCELMKIQTYKSTQNEMHKIINNIKIKKYVNILIIRISPKQIIKVWNIYGFFFIINYLFTFF